LSLYEYAKAPSCDVSRDAAQGDPVEIQYSSQVQIQCPSPVPTQSNFEDVEIPKARPTHHLVHVGAPEAHTGKRPPVGAEHIRELVIVRREQRATAGLVEDMIESGIGDREARVEGGASSDPGSGS
jgi:hypothetical protein